MILYVQSGCTLRAISVAKRALTLPRLPGLARCGGEDLGGSDERVR